MNILEKKTNIKDSYVKNKNWNKDIAYKIAEKEKIILKKEHWLIIIQLRKFYIKYKISPEINLFISFITL